MFIGASLSKPHIDHDNVPRTRNNGMYLCLCLYLSMVSRARPHPLQAKGEGLVKSMHASHVNCPGSWQNYDLNQSDCGMYSRDQFYQTLSPRLQWVLAHETNLSMYHLPHVCRTLVPEIRVCPEMLRVFQYIGLLTCVIYTTALLNGKDDWNCSHLP